MQQLSVGSSVAERRHPYRRWSMNNYGLQHSPRCSSVAVVSLLSQTVSAPLENAALLKKPSISPVQVNQMQQLGQFHLTRTSLEGLSTFHFVRAWSHSTGWRNQSLYRNTGDETRRWVETSWQNAIWLQVGWQSLCQTGLWLSRVSGTTNEQLIWNQMVHKRRL